jgi:hypothetical protein
MSDLLRLETSPASWRRSAASGEVAALSLATAVAARSGSARRRQRRAAAAARAELVGMLEARLHALRVGNGGVGGWQRACAADLTAAFRART